MQQCAFKKSFIKKSLHRCSKVHKHSLGDFFDWAGKTQWVSWDWVNLDLVYMDAFISGLLKSVLMGLNWISIGLVIIIWWNFFWTCLDSHSCIVLSKYTEMLHENLANCVNRTHYSDFSLLQSCTCSVLVYSLSMNF